MDGPANQERVHSSFEKKSQRTDLKNTFLRCIRGSLSHSARITNGPLNGNVATINAHPGTMTIRGMG